MQLLPVINVQPDYSQQLTEIIKLLSRPTFPPWAVAIVGAFTGALASIASEPLKTWLMNRHKKKKLERRLVRDLVYAYSALKVFHLPILEDRRKKMSANERPLAFQWLCQDLPKAINTVAYDDAQKNPELLYDLESYQDIRALYERLHDLLDCKGYIERNESASLYSRLQLFIHLLEKAFSDHAFSVELVPKKLTIRLRQRLLDVAAGREKPYWQDEINKGLEQATGLVSTLVEVREEEHEKEKL